MTVSRTPAPSPRAARPRRAAATPDPSELAALLRVSATRLSRRLRQQAEAGLSPSQLSALTAVARHGSMTLGELADYERVAPPTVTKIVAKLEGDGLLARTIDPHDRRVARVAVTKAGDRLLAEARQRKTAWLSGRIAQLDDDERRRLAAALDVLDALTNDEPSSLQERS
jgi:DNA-binding MarR family transcriptional regulator